MGLALALIFGLSPLSVCGFLLIYSFWPVKKKPVAVAGGRSLAVLAAFSLSLIQYIESAAVRQAKADARYIIYFIYNIYSDFAKVRKSPMYQGFSAFLRCVFLAHFSGVFCPFFGGSPPKVRGCLAQNSGVYILIVTPLILLPAFISS